MTASETDSAERSAIARRFANAVPATETPESIGRALYRFVLTEGAEKGELSSDGKTIRIPLEVILHVPGPVAPGERTYKNKSCWTAFGHELLCLEHVIVQE